MYMKGSQESMQADAQGYLRMMGTRESKESNKKRKKGRKQKQKPNIQHNFNMYENTTIQSRQRKTITESIEHDKLDYQVRQPPIRMKPVLPELPKFGNEALYATVRTPCDAGNWNVPRVGKLEKTNYLNRPWLVRKRNQSYNFPMDLPGEAEKVRNEYHYIKSRYKSDGRRPKQLILANQL